jgi:hypothetical protein
LPRKPITCPSCGALVSGGRLSCPTCGTLVATVTGSPKPQAATKTVAAVPAPAAPRARPAARPATDAVASSRPTQATVGARSQARPPEAAPVRAPISPAALKPEPTQEPPPWALRPVARPGSILHELETRPRSGWLSAQADEYDSHEPSNVPPPAIPGAYLAPSAAFTAPAPRPRGGRPFEPTVNRTAQPAYLTSATGAVSPVAFAPGFNPPVAVPAGIAQKGRTGVSMQAPAELPGWLAIAGSAIGAVSFLMPWSRDGVIGAVGSSYFDRWGLANTGYLPLVLVALGLLAINGVPNPIPSWIRAGVAPLMIGGALFGLDWAYQTRPYSDGLGVTLLLVASLVLVAGGLVGVRSGRHPAAPRAV